MKLRLFEPWNKLLKGESHASQLIILKGIGSPTTYYKLGDSKFQHNSYTTSYGPKFIAFTYKKNGPKFSPNNKEIKISSILKKYPTKTKPIYKILK